MTPSGLRPTRTSRCSEFLAAVLTAALGLLALHIVLLLFTGGYTFRAYGLTIGGGHLFAPTMLLLALALLRRVILERSRSSEPRAARGVAVTLLLGCLIVYLANGKTIWSGDTLPARYLPLSILRQGNFDLDEFSFLYDVKKVPDQWFLQFVRGHVVSDYPVGAALLAVPFYVPTALGSVNPESHIIEEIEKLSAATIVALSVLLLYLTLRRLTTAGDALVIAVVYALGTSSLSESSQALWQHGASQLALAAAFYCFVRGRREARWVALAGFPLAFAVISRPSDGLLALPLGLFVIVHAPRHLWGFVLGGLLPVAFQLWYSATYFGNPFRVQFFFNVATAVQTLPAGTGGWTTAVWTGLTGILLSPGRGLFIYSAVLLLSFLGLGLAWRRGGDLLLRYTSPGVILTILLYAKWENWWGGSSYGPRLLADLGPILALALYPIGPLARTNRALKAAFVVLAAWSIGAHAIGAFADDRSWNWSGNAVVDRLPERLWSWSDNQLINPPKDALRRALIATLRLPTSRTAPALVSASYETTSPRRLVVACGKTVDVSVRATNVGRAAWLAHGKRDWGVVRLGWRWPTVGPSPPIGEGRVPLVAAVLPGQSHEFLASIVPPRERGTYLLEFRLINEPGRWLAEGANDPIHIAVTVETPPRWPERTDAFLNLLEELRVPADDPPRVVISTDRSRHHSGDTLPLVVAGSVGERSWLVDVYLLLRGPGGARWFYDGRQLRQDTGCQWTPLATAIRLERGQRPGARFDVATTDMPPGTYTWHLFVARVGEYRIITTAQADFVLSRPDSRP
jgi:hypothetical protein